MDGAVPERIQRARKELDEGHLGAAAGTLGDIVTATRDPGLLEEMRELAEQGLERAGRFSRREWSHLLEEVEQRLSNGDVVRPRSLSHSP